MKTILIFSVFLFFTSCASTTFYQVLKATPENGIKENNLIVFEDPNCFITYDLWEEFGHSGFSIYNKTEDDLKVDLANSFYVHNGTAYPYYQGKTVSSSVTTQVSTLTAYSLLSPAKAQSESSVNSASYVESPVVIVPAGTRVNLGEFPIVAFRYKECDFLSFPSVGKIQKLSFRKENSPYVFSNLITYTANGETTRTKNEFYVSEISNLPISEMYVKNPVDECGKKILTRNVIKTEGPEGFYIKYVSN